MTPNVTYTEIWVSCYCPHQWRRLLKCENISVQQLGFIGPPSFGNMHHEWWQAFPIKVGAQWNIHDPVLWGPAPYPPDLDNWPTRPSAMRTLPFSRPRQLTNTTQCYEDQRLTLQTSTTGQHDPVLWGPAPYPPDLDNWPTRPSAMRTLPFRPRQLANTTQCYEDQRLTLQTSTTGQHDPVLWGPAPHPPADLDNWGPPKGGGGSGAMCYVQNSLACYVLCKFLFTLLCEIKIGCYA